MISQSDSGCTYALVLVGCMRVSDRWPSRERLDQKQYEGVVDGLVKDPFSSARMAVVLTFLSFSYTSDSPFPSITTCADLAVFCSGSQA